MTEFEIQQARKLGLSRGKAIKSVNAVNAVIAKKQMLRELRLETQKWFKKMDKEVKRAKL